MKQLPHERAFILGAGNLLVADEGLARDLTPIATYGLRRKTTVRSTELFPAVKQGLGSFLDAVEGELSVEEA